jgi:quercetin dioxygenase-like cupin family protein
MIQSSPMHTYRWESLPEDELNPLLSRQAIHTSGLTIARLYLKAGAVVPVHHHINEQVSMVEKGALEFLIAGEEHIVRAGGMIPIPPDVPHSVRALEDSIAVDVFTPRREDWIRGDDAYLRR